MKKTLLSILLTLAGWSILLAQGENNSPGVGEMKVEGYVKSGAQLVDGDTILLSWSEGRLNRNLQTTVRNGKFGFSVPSIAADTRLWLFAGRNYGKTTRRIMAEPGTVKVTIQTDMQSATVEGGAQNMAFSAYESRTRHMLDKMDQLRGGRSRKTIDSASYSREMKNTRTALDSVDKHFVKEYPYSWRAMEIMEEEVKNYLAREWAFDPEEKRLRQYKTTLSELEEPARSGAAYLIEHLQNAEDNRLITFSGETPDGNIFDIASLKGRVFLIDFWGSWCHWCRKAHPHMKELYAKYKSKGFEIVGVGHEFSGTREEDWKRFKKAIADDGITWPQILNNPEKRDLTKEYLVFSYPSKFLVDQQGKIILRVGDDHERLIDKKLEELLGAPSGPLKESGK